MTIIGEEPMISIAQDGQVGHIQASSKCISIDTRTQ
jgi:hypothetical protein